MSTDGEEKGSEDGPLRALWCLDVGSMDLISEHFDDSSPFLCKVLTQILKLAIKQFLRIKGEAKFKDIP